MPGAGPGTAAECYFHPLAQLLVFVAQVLRALVAMQDGWPWVFTEGVEDGCERQLATVSGTQPPTHNLPGFEVKHDCQVMLLAPEAQMREVLYPTARVYHSGVTEAGLWTLLVPKHGEVFQGIRGGRYLGWRRAATALLVRTHDDDTSQRADTPSLFLAPAQVQGKPLYAVERVFAVCEPKRADGLLIPVAQNNCWLVVATAGYSQSSYKVSVPPRVDLVQDG